MKSILDESKKAIAVIALILALILVICIFFIAYDAVTISQFNTFSNVLNNLTTPLLTFTAIILTFLAFYVQYDFNKKQSINDSLNQFNHNFDIVIKNLNPNLYYNIIAINNACLTILNRYNENKSFYIDKIKSNNFVSALQDDYNHEILLIHHNDKTANVSPINFINLFETIRKFITLLKVLETELENVNFTDTQKITIIYNYILKFEIATAPEIINFLGIELAESKFLTNKKLYKEVLLKHYALNPKVIEIFNDIIK